MSTKIFGKLPSGKRLERIKQSKNYVDGKFKNLSFTPDLSEDASYPTVLKDFFCDTNSTQQPPKKLPSQKTDLLNLDINEDVLVWFGHSSYFIQIDGKKILVDPVFSGNASPLSFTTKSFDGSDVYTTDEFPEIDYLFISHDHYDHLDYKTIIQLQPKIKKVITGLGTGEHFEYWNFAPDKIIEGDWFDKIELEDGFVVHTTPGRHFSGRSLNRNKALWTSFVLQTPTMKLFLGGDSGYDTHIADIGNKFGPFDLVILECGQYNKNWKYIHMMPSEVLQAAQDLQTKRLLPVHWSKFKLAIHGWTEPIETLLSLNNEIKLPILTPMIGEKLLLKDDQQVFTEWWKNI